MGILFHTQELVYMGSYQLQEETMYSQARLWDSQF